MELVKVGILILTCTQAVAATDHCKAKEASDGVSLLQMPLPATVSRHFPDARPTAQAAEHASFFGPEWQSVEELQHWLVDTEARYGGLVWNVTCRESEDVVPMQGGQRAKTVCAGGDRMASQPPNHNYGICYAMVIDAFAKIWEATFKDDGSMIPLAAEVGVLLGSGVATWADLFPQAQVLALDQYTDNIEANTPNLLAQGAFSSGMYVAHAFDQQAPSHSDVDAYMQASSGQLFWVVDDASHVWDWTVQTHEYLKQYLHRSGVYIIEDMLADDERRFREHLSTDTEMHICPYAVPSRAFYLLTHKQATGSPVATAVASLGFLPVQ